MIQRMEPVPSVKTESDVDQNESFMDMAKSIRAFLYKEMGDELKWWELPPAKKGSVLGKALAEYLQLERSMTRNKVSNIVFHILVTFNYWLFLIMG